ncbi:peptidylprolyl isomerase [Adlercreutzia sp. ZJ242]|uniref:FKBP-type peptidyl-prolyl cis-trans isomerase n=1 Tax=Adlercreutzia sp. ZJ242 TaxID=2709409 RepID=UPI0013EBEA90|nr:FKBP-type peptidyl-prolyl cis-trans isomerase [Adlercreutzia sp. ZJ242]
MVSPGQKLVIHVAGTLADGYVFVDTWTHNAPLEVTLGDGQLPQGLERVIATMRRGERRVVELAAKDAYGERDESLVFDVPASAVPHAEDLPVGGFIMADAGGGPLRLKVLKVEGGRVWLDQNHELAGRPVTFEVELVRDGTESAVDVEQSARGCSCGALRESLAGGACRHEHHHGC